MRSTTYRKHYECLEQVIGCKWSVSVLTSVQEGVTRPGALERTIQGISTKVLSERLRKLTAYGLLTKKKYHATVLRTEYSLTENGKRLVAIINQIHELDKMDQAQAVLPIAASAAQADR